MSWSKPRFSCFASAAIALCLLGTSLASCGFHPLYAEKEGSGNVDSRLASIHVASIPERAGQELTSALRDGFNPRSIDAKSQYELDVRLQTLSADIIARTNGTATRTNTNLIATWTLTRLADNKVVVQGVSTAANGHDILTNDYANVVATQHDVETSLRGLTDDIQARIAIYLQSAS